MKDPNEIRVWSVPTPRWFPSYKPEEGGWLLSEVFTGYPRLSRICPEKHLVYIKWSDDDYENILTPCGDATYDDIYEASLFLRLST